MPSKATSAPPKVVKTYKLYINGAFPRSESGRSLPVKDAKGRVLAHVSHASRKDLRDAIEAAHAAHAKWANATAYNRGQVLYRIAEMIQSREEECVALLCATGEITRKDARAEVDLSIDRCIAWAGWADKIAAVLGGKQPVAGPYLVFSTPEPIGVVVAIAPEKHPLLGLLSVLLPALAVGNAVVLCCGGRNLLLAATFGEALATSDVPAGVANVLTGRISELIPWIASHRDVHACIAAGLSKAETRTLELGAAENMKRVTILDRNIDLTQSPVLHSPFLAERLVEIKTVWHPSTL
ncbi:MAG: aldehyde dehydrogenase family protein [Phycisphaerales bacterium]|nr:aldehyde dehydrogenase family protein [Phycisphaerales bacterium]